MTFSLRSCGAAAAAVTARGGGDYRCNELRDLSLTNSGSPFYRFVLALSRSGRGSTPLPPLSTQVIAHVNTPVCGVRSKIDERVRVRGLLLRRR